MRGAAATGFGVTTAAALGAATLEATAFGAAAFTGGLAATFEAVAFEAVAFAAVLAVFSGIALLLFFEDFVADAFLAVLTGALARPLAALRLAEAAFLVVLEALFLRVFCDTACARKLPRPCSMFYGNPPGPQIRMARFGL
jgi:hypothetical protein